MILSVFSLFFSLTICFSPRPRVPLPCASAGRQARVHEGAGNNLQAQGKVRVMGKGTWENVRPGVYRVSFSMGRDPVTGRYVNPPKRTCYTTAKSKSAQLKEVEAFAMEYRRELNEKGIVYAPATMTMGKFLDSYHKSRKGLIRASTYERESQHIKCAKKMLARHRLSEVTPPILRAIYSNALSEETVSASEVYEVNKLLRKAFKQGMSDGLVSTNPAEAVKIRQPQYKEKQVLTAKQAAEFKSKLLELPLGPYPVAALLLLETGCRRGEILGLQWKNVMLPDRRLVICQQLTKELEITSPKSAMSNRIISISGSTVEMLERWMEAQKEQFAARRVDWTDEAFVAHCITFETVVEDGGEAKVPVGSFIQPHNFNRWFKDFCADNGFGRYTKNARTITRAGKTLHRRTAYEGILPHSLRHTQSTLLIGSGVDVKTVQARLGHSSPSLTLKQYTRALSKNDEAASALFDELLEASAAPGRDVSR